MPQDEALAPQRPATHHPPGYRLRPLHLALLISDLLGRAQPLALSPAWLAMAAISCWPWGPLRLPVAALALAFTVLDGTGLALLPRRGRSFGPVTPPLLALATMHTLISLGVGLAWPNWGGLVVATSLDLLLSSAFLYATWVEPFRISVSRLSLSSRKLAASDPIRLVHLSDLHVERMTTRERALVRQVEALAPDVMVLTGDYLNLSYVEDERAQSDTRALLAELCHAAKCPVYAVTGSPPVDLAGIVPEVFGGLPITWLNDAFADARVGDQAVRILGIKCSRERLQDAPRLRQLMTTTTTDLFTLLLYHSPDLMPEASELAIDLYVCGHTHGGQVRLPLFGALITSSDFWKRYEIGRHEEHGTTMYVSRGLGMEGLGAPRARFLSPPEIGVWTLSGPE